MMDGMNLLNASSTALWIFVAVMLVAGIAAFVKHLKD